MRWSPESNCPDWIESGFGLLKMHLQRLKNSAEYFGFKFEEAEILLHLHELEKSFCDSPMRVRLELSRRGKIKVETYKLENSSQEILKLALAKAPIDDKNPFLYHKTTRREIYEKARESCPGYDDVLLWNERNEVCEGTLANIAILEGEIWWTPPISSGLLPGTFRESLLESGKIKEKVIHLDELKNAKSIALFNSVRGWRLATLDS